MTWFELLMASFSYGFMWRALVVGIAIAITSSFIGPFLVLKKFSMIGHGLSHVAFAAVAIGLLTNTEPLIVTMVVVVVVSVFILKLNEHTKIHGDAAIGLTAAVAMAFGTVLASVAGGFNVDLFSYLFGSILTIQRVDVILSIFLSIIVVIVVVALYHDLFSMTFEEEYARVVGIKTKRLNTILAILVGMTIVIGMRAIGTILISSLIIFPTIIAMQFNRGFKGTILIAVISSVLIVTFGLFGSFVLDYPSGSSIVLLNGLVFFGIYLVNRIRRLRF
ncbi:MAG: metal ABC transporter permease [Candidatus Izemoplasmataceae bacterium]|jgi:zinc transport system permease protein|uniref:metal ABC transporter permease n=1 Tax=Liberiplasma polymorphum TaxID=3374570 RepID=UPI0037760D77